MKNKLIRAEKRERKKRITMKVSGKSVMRLQRIIVGKIVDPVRERPAEGTASAALGRLFSNGVDKKR